MLPNTSNQPITPELFSNENHHEKKNYSVFEEQNPEIKKAMEDFTICEINLTGNNQFDLFVILDGHGGSEIAKFSKMNYPQILKSALESLKLSSQIESIIKTSIIQLTDSLPEPQKMCCGTTFCGVLIDKNNKNYYTINLGDSQAYKATRKLNLSDQLQWELVKLTDDHNLKNEAEKERVMKLKGVFSNRVGGQLLITRAVGDCAFNEFGILRDPDVICHKFTDEQLLILGSDGVWDYANSVDIINCLEKNYGNGVQVLGKNLIGMALEKSLDNLSLIIVTTEKSE